MQQLAPGRSGHDQALSKSTANRIKKMEAKPNISRERQLEPIFKLRLQMAQADKQMVPALPKPS